MANMSYCRFENTLRALEDCAEHIEDKKLSDIEEDCRKRLVALCAQIADKDSDLYSMDQDE